MRASLQGDVPALCALVVVLAGAALATQPHLLQQPAAGIARESRGNHRVKLLFPLLIRISLRLAALVPMMGTALLLLLVLVTFAKKAFLISLVTLGIVLFDKLNSLSVHHSQATQQKYIHVVPVVKEQNGHHSNNLYRSEEDYRTGMLLNDIPQDDNFNSWEEER